jgi:hypothetical protein
MNANRATKGSLNPCFMRAFLPRLAEVSRQVSLLQWAVEPCRRAERSPKPIVPYPVPHFELFLAVEPDAAQTPT